MSVKQYGKVNDSRNKFLAKNKSIAMIKIPIKICVRSI